MSGPVAFLPDLGHWAPSDGRSHTLQQLSCTLSCNFSNKKHKKHDSCRSCRSCRSCPTDYELVMDTEIKEFEILRWYPRWHLATTALGGTDGKSTFGGADFFELTHLQKEC